MASLAHLGRGKTIGTEELWCIQAWSVTLNEKLQHPQSKGEKILNVQQYTKAIQSDDTV